MNALPTRFFATAALFALAGMIWGVQMSATHDHTLAPAHGHLNLLGFVVMAVFGAYYALAPRAAASRIARVHFWLHTAMVIILPFGIARAITGQGEALAQIGSLAAIASMLMFIYVVWRYRAGAGEQIDKAAPLPAE
ncbi:hypothetical protein [Pseudohoeflea coraliihabitans]|uniref:Uncharacterized protein n=1 Tax=Pseudohoeflea coraliihabitans TaxID=2860393 RepID=A0ABS6WS88_9HYPH|nr:hypothetical protein [Pseudohoeflea sp. DP4N28-3]MBW3098523.1 hypothetical protein [Pseudohoeflea sp. DP4N28-3]